MRCDCGLREKIEMRMKELKSLLDEDEEAYSWAESRLDELENLIEE